MSLIKREGEHFMFGYLLLCQLLTFLQFTMILFVIAVTIEKCILITSHLDSQPSLYVYLMRLILHFVPMYSKF